MPCCPGVARRGRERAKGRARFPASGARPVRNRNHHGTFPGRRRHRPRRLDPAGATARHAGRQASAAGCPARAGRPYGTAVPCLAPPGTPQCRRRGAYRSGRSGPGRRLVACRPASRAGAVTSHLARRGLPGRDGRHGWFGGPVLSGAVGGPGCRAGPGRAEPAHAQGGGAAWRVRRCRWLMSGGDAGDAFREPQYGCVVAVLGADRAGHRRATPVTGCLTRAAAGD